MDMEKKVDHHDRTWEVVNLTITMITMPICRQMCQAIHQIRRRIKAGKADEW